MGEDFCLLVSSFDRYSVCWEPFAHGLNKYWPDHPEKVFWITNQLDAPLGKSIKVGEDQGWAKNLVLALNQIDCEIVLYAQEDYWIQAAVNGQQIAEYAAIIRSGQADYIRLYPAPRADYPFPGDGRLGVLAEEAAYRTSLQMALWRKRTLQELLDLRETPWEFEEKGSRRSKKFGDKFLCVSNRQCGIDYVFTAIVNGYWSKLAYAYAMREEIVVDFDGLPQKPPGKRVMDWLRGQAYQAKKHIKRVFC